MHYDDLVSGTWLRTLMDHSVQLRTFARRQDDVLRLGTVKSPSWRPIFDGLNKIRASYLQDCIPRGQCVAPSGILRSWGF